MRHAALAAILALPLVVLPVIAQTTSPPAEETPESLSASYKQAMQAKDWAGALAAAEKLVDLSATADHLRMLSEAQIDSGGLDAALATCDRALAQAQLEKPAEGQPDTTWKTLLGKIYVDKGNAYLKLRRNADAIAVYNQAAAVDPNPSTAYWNICVTLYNTGDMQKGPDACRRASTVDPARADTWFVLASLLFAESSKTDAQGKFIISDECRQALNKYLELAPNGPHAADVKEMLDAAQPAQ